MKAKDKAIELVKKFRIYAFTCDYDYEAKGAKNEYHNAEKCAIIAVDEIMKQCYDYRDIDLQASYDYWNEVKSEIQKL
jgi:hypothetical protein